MIFTLYYMYSTVIQWWRLGRLRNKINGTLNSHNALMVCNGSTISDSKNRCCLENLLFYNDEKIGCTIVPKQRIDLNQWILFPKDYNYFPVYISNRQIVLTPPKIHMLIQAKLDDYKKHHSEIIQIEHYGELYAWRVQEHFEIILKTDMNNLTKLVSCFFDHNIDINHELKLLRIETIDIEGYPVKMKYNMRYSLENRLKYSLAPVHWKKFVDEVKSLYSKLQETSNKILDNPTIMIESSSKSDETKKVPVSEVKPIKKSLESTKYSKIHKRESKNKLEVSTLEARRPKSSERKSKGDKFKESGEHKKREHKSKTKDVDNEGGNSSEVKVRVKAPKLGECTNLSSKETDHKSKHKTKKDAQLNSKDDQYKQLVGESTKILNGHENIDGVDASDHVETKFRVWDETFLKPPNVLVYADSVLAKDNVKNVLHAILNNHKYTVYDFPTNVANPQLWMDSTALVVVCGNVPPNLTSQLLQYLILGGRLLCLCSDLLYSVLNIFSTAEVREHELVRFSYEQWKRVKMMHHVFCYQASPAKRQFSKDSDQSNHSSRGSSPVAPRTPSTVDIQHNGKKYTVQVQVLGAEETWHTPSLLLAAVKNTKGTAIFSQVHLEIDPTQYQDDESKYTALTESNQARLEILKHILSQHLSMDCTAVVNVNYTPGFFLGMHLTKLEMLSDSDNIKDNKLNNEKINVHFCGKDVEPETATANFLPVLIHSCPSNFSTVKYFENLDTVFLGRLVIYVDVLTSSQFLLGKTLRHGLAVIVRQQTQGVGRTGNTWLSPVGCAMFSLQLHIPMNSTLGRSLPLVQHLIMIAVVSSVRSLPGYKSIDVGLKWPNDLYANGDTKIGGITVNSTIYSDNAILNIGLGVNLDNTQPTTCINRIIANYNEKEKKDLKVIVYEEFFARTFNEIERIYNIVQEGNVDYLFELYYKYWLHSGASITVNTSERMACQANIIGIDEYGYLKVCFKDGTISSVQPDGNSFDMLKGLIVPKVL